MKIDFLTLFPEMFSSLNHSIIGRAIDSGLVDINCVNIRDFSLNKHKKVDDYVFGGGEGMLMMPQPLKMAIWKCNLTFWQIALLWLVRW